ncbi:MAG: hypothetical protein QXJ74_01925 [Nitrososphaera sp.]|uniref:hypothetical protein n=1 Tax=Nitrososphaera sp. TaxID=1971748 RepID=UPI0018124EDC|nr:hypothetical protein [Nitrososphaera sp.]NWG38309.1 hypothetical protein [Nitrososphaera sp.]
MTDLISSVQLEKAIEKDVKELLSSLGLQGHRISRGPGRTPDYGAKDVAFEVTAVHVYSPEIQELVEIRSFLSENMGHDWLVYMYANDKDRPSIQVLRKQKSRGNYSLLRTRQHVSCYRAKIISKLEDKYQQSSEYHRQVVVMDFRAAPFDPAALAAELAHIMKERGEMYPSLLGVIFALPSTPEAPMLSKPDYFFVSNSQAKEVLAELDSIAKIPVSVIRIAPIQHEICAKALSGPLEVEFSPIQVPEEELKALGLPI